MSEPLYARGDDDTWRPFVRCRNLAEARAKAADGRYYSAVAVELHLACCTGSERPPQMLGGGAMMIHIEVTHEDIERGIPLAAADCPIALALRRATGLARGDVRVWEERAALRPDSDRSDAVSVSLPEEATWFVRAYDDPSRADMVAPFAFDLEVPS